jgi:hypothetical protein
VPRRARVDGPIRVGSAAIGSFGPGVDSTSQSSRESSGSRMWGKAWPYLRLPRGGHPCGQHTYPSRRLVCLGRSPTRRRAAAPVHLGINFPAWSVERHRARALGRIDPRVGGNPFGDFDESLQWRRALDDWLAELGRHVYENVRLASTDYSFQREPRCAATPPLSRRLDGFSVDAVVPWLITVPMLSSWPEAGPAWRRRCLPRLRAESPDPTN